MTRKIFIGVVSVSLIIMLICAGLVTGILYDYMGEQLDGQLAGEAVLVEEGWRGLPDGTRGKNGYCKQNYAAFTYRRCAV